MAIGYYTFLPWLRRGAANAITAPAAAASRATISVSLAVNDGAATGAPISKIFRLAGPGDVIGINPDLVVRTEPKAWVTDFEPNYLAFIDFYDEDFLWRHTPLPPEPKRLMPWLALLVLAESEFEIRRLPDRPLSSVALKNPADAAKLFPKLDQLWAWAHVQIAGSAGGAGTAPDLAALNSKLAQEPDSGVCRLLSPRRLSANTAYTAFVVPTFEVGRLAGLGTTFNDDTTPGNTLAWTGGASEFPILYQWYFRTGDGGDFEDLVERLEPRAIDPRVGIRDIDIANPRFGMPQVTEPVAAGHHKGVVGLEGALKSPTMQSKRLDALSQFPQDAAPIINLPATAQATGAADPVVAPPLYGGWHALVDRVDPAGMANWVNDLSLDPRNRAAGGLGARVIRTKQEDYMKAAWQQVGEIIAANRKAAFLRFGQWTAESSFVKQLATLPEERFVTVSAPVFARVLGSPMTIRGLLATSRVPVAALSPAFRKLLRPRGLVARRALPPADRVAGVGVLAQAINDGRASAAPPPPPVAGPTLGGVGADAGAGHDLAKFLAAWGWWLVLLLLILALVAFFFMGAAGIALAVALVAAAAILAAATYRAKQATDSLASLDLEAIKPETIPANPPAGFGLSPPGGSAGPALGASEGAELGSAFKDFATLIGSRPPPLVQPPRFDFANADSKVRFEITPSRSFPKRAAKLIRIGNLSIIDYATNVYAKPKPPAVAAEPQIVPVMAYPDIKDAMYRPLADLSHDLLVPNLGLIPPNSISLMLTNPPFIESYMAGLNHEFARELLWREYPTDCRGSPFRQFWDVGSIPTPALDTATRSERLKDIKPLHKWSVASPLGSHENRGNGSTAEHVVLVIRGDLLKRYPNTIIYAQEAQWSSDTRRPNQLALYDEDGAKALANVADPKLHYPIFRATVPPDLTFIGFDAGLAAVRGHKDLDETAAARASIPASELGWFFVLQEVVGETRFGLDERPPPAGHASERFWDNLSWENLTLPGGAIKIIDLAQPFAQQPAGTRDDLAWTPGEGANAADLAVILEQKPVLIAVHGREMLARGKVEPPGGP